MLRQEINLYRQFLKPQTAASYLTWKRYWLLNLLFAVLMVVIFSTSVLKEIYLSHESEKLSLQITKFKSEFEKLKKTFPQLFFSENIDDSVADLKKRMEAQKKIVNILLRDAPFSNVFVGLSRSITKNLWLNEIHISKSGKVIDLDGSSIGMVNINDYLNTLEKDPSFKRYTLVVRAVKNVSVDDANSHLNFKINMVKNSDE